MDLHVQMVPVTESYDLLVNGRIRVTLRTAFPSQRRHRVTVGDRRYDYRYKTWHFNFHHHGRLEERYTDFFVCVVFSGRGGRIREVFVIPWDAITGKTFSLHGGRRTYKGRYAAFRENWEIIPSAVKREGKLLRVA